MRTPIPPLVRGALDHATSRAVGTLPHAHGLTKPARDRCSALVARAVVFAAPTARSAER